MSNLRSPEEDYVDSTFEWSFLELTDRMWQFLHEDSQTATVKTNINTPVNFYQILDTGSVNNFKARRDSEATDTESVFKPDLGPLSQPSQLLSTDINFKETISRWAFDIFSLNHLTNGHAMQAVAFELFSRHNLLSQFKLSEPQFMRFVIQVEKRYRRNPYHNASHATDVLQTVYCIIKKTGFLEVMDPLEVFCILLTAILHDVEHTGTNNNFHKNSGSELAKLYVISVLENHHLRVGLRMLKEFDILKSLNKDKFEQFRWMFYSMILSTDMANHFLLITNMKLMQFTSTICPTRVRIRRIMMFILHAADISNPAKTWDIHKVWVSLLCEEFFMQGDKERELKLPVSPNCDRHTANIATLQIGFMQTFTKETFLVMDKLLEKEITSAGLLYTGYMPWQDCMIENMIRWNGKWKFLKYDQISELLVETAKPRMSIIPTTLHRQEVEEKYQNKRNHLLFSALKRASE